MDSRITKTTVFRTEDGKVHDSEDDAIMHLAANDNEGIIEDFIKWFGDKNDYSEKHRAAVRNALRAFHGWKAIRGYAADHKAAQDDEREPPEKIESHVIGAQQGGNP